MQDAAEEAGGLYITAYNEGQLNAAFYAIGLAIADAVSFTAPVVSVDAANKIQNGDDLYMGQFIPMDAGYWPGNLKKFKLGDGSENRPDKWEIYDAGTNDTSTEADENLATNPDGTFKDSEELTGFWRAVDPCGVRDVLALLP
jgi:type IV pilus assembly protein PilY1